MSTEKEIKRSSVYTRGGDKGRTSLMSGQRISKGSLRLNTYGSVDELNSFVGLLRALTPSEIGQDVTLAMIQDRLFTCGSYLAADFRGQKKEFDLPSGVTDEDIKTLEHQIDVMDSELPKLTEFIIPAGGQAASVAHVCRTVTRRTERAIYLLLDTDPEADVEAGVKNFINRLSDYFFVLARVLARHENGEEVTWKRFRD
ncbi:cob(I)yrinic acid a,c-diamide adenosyltransferase [Porphyromonas levii]|uniref:cob(I)yrinic acid a,c-diamide adenosyltransferase n=1 Tax=Porphyromonas levii TaxID=28114 RepID=UPI00037AF775|nr:cob(I)yrinic acid a,c-diamide adenosyltransferase [Porphyromonas levii]MBR8764552.1 Corrinoid adenosyltransferase [Porphyromonas levii]MBR8770600.1 Corrinoid adenosyltransferase [Porphyromonas levii]MBR8803558.1 Corrinoid adenosyltransferase [Porphyromonas levii]